MILRAGAQANQYEIQTVATLPTFREVRAERRCILPIDGFISGRQPKGGKQPLGPGGMNIVKAAFRFANKGQCQRPVIAWRF